ncbi:fibronectin type III domain-containing protein [Cellulomonas xiejunii]|uniref:Fibronectin type III domain-containing protein n=1 Tax=Cellulomonas xiejunii TaxID=2968083 RepID=A0ABY5KSN1_9CELL|nr:fibronectin type III domain-containing protein [Cellulomonas xiejunii]MCC2322430.1 fibronectin type III domain-containing protein [Cellulomonas xiejunii]UUI72476.1 fibronectin type III domain-containing protein [Cellulomonas xiejunii]
MRVRKPVATTAAVALVAGTIWSAAPAAAASASNLASAILTPAAAAHLTGSTITTPSDSASAVRTDSVAGFPSRAGGTYAVLSTGDATELTSAGQGFEASTGYSSSATRGGAFDVTTLELTLNVPQGANCLLGVTFRFLSDEFPDFVGGGYNDVFIAEAGATTWSVTGGTINAPDNFAFDSAGRFISVNSGLFDGSSATAEAVGTVFNGATPKLTAQVPLTGGTQQKLFFSILDQGDAELDSAVMIDHLRLGTVDDPADDCRPGATSNPTEILVSAAAPTQVDVSGTAGDTYTVPASEGITYSVGGTPVAAGTYPGTGTVVVTAQAQAGYAVSGPSQFTLVFSDIAQVTATEPTWTDTWGTDEDTYTIPSVTGVRYSVDGDVVAPGTYPATGTVTVDAAATTGYDLTGATRFTHTFTDIRQVTAVEPTWTDASGTDEDTYTIPSVTGVQYSVDGEAVAPGTYPATGTVTVDAAATTGYGLTGATRFTHTFTDITHVSALAPTVVDQPGTVLDRVTIPQVTGVAYLVDGVPVAAGTHALTGDVLVTAQAADARHVLVGTSSFPLHLSDADVPGAPVLVAEAGSGSVALSWAEPAGDPTGYELQTSRDGTVWASAGTTTSTRATLDALVDGTPVSFRVRGVNGLGHGAWSAPVTATPVSPPAAPSITRVQPDNRRLHVTVAAPASDGGSPVVRYERTLDGGRTWAAVDGSPFELTGLVNGTTYRVQVRAVTAVGAGAASAVATGTPVAAPVTVPGDDGTPARPRVEPGVVQAWAGGAPAPVTVGVQDGRRTAAGQGFDVTLGGVDARGTQLPVDASGRVVVDPDGFVSVSGGGFAPGEVVDVWLFSTPVLLGSVTVQADGTFAGRLRLPAGVPAGRHTLQINGTRADGTLVSVAAGVLVAAAADEPDELAVTGAPAGSGALLALWLLVAGAGAVLVARRAHRV